MSKLEIRTNGDVYQSLNFEGNVTAIMSGPQGSSQLIIPQDATAYIDLRGVRQVGPVTADPDWDSAPVIMNAQFRLDPNVQRRVDVNAEVQGGASTDSRDWDFGDGNTATDQSNHENVYENEGEYTITFSYGGEVLTQKVSFPVPSGVPIDSWLPFGFAWPGGEDPDPPADDPPTQNSTKAQILSWLDRKGVKLSADAEHRFTKDELLDIVKNFLDDEEDPVGMVIAAKEKAEAKEKSKEHEKAPVKK